MHILFITNLGFLTLRTCTSSEFVANVAYILNSGFLPHVVFADSLVPYSLRGDPGLDTGIPRTDDIKNGLNTCCL